MADVPNENAEGIGSRYALVMAVAKRAKQIREGSPKLVECKSKNPITIALEEIASGAVTMRIPTTEEIELAEQMEAIPKASTAAREAAELLRIEGEETGPEGESEAPNETVPSSELFPVTGADVYEAAPEIESPEEIEEDQEFEASEDADAEETDEDAEEEESPAEE